MLEIDSLLESKNSRRNARTELFYRTDCRLGSATRQDDLNNWIFDTLADIIPFAHYSSAGHMKKSCQANEQNCSETNFNH